MHQIFEKLYKDYKNNNFSHAYLFETNNISLCYEDLTKLIKKIIFLNKTKDEIEEIGKLYDNDLLCEIKLIQSDDNLIKKEQIKNIQEQFIMKPTNISKNIYIMLKPEKMNLSSSNSLLKFLEEPEEDIIGFMITSNSYSVLPTIKSRCIIKRVNYDIDNIAENLDFTEEMYDICLNVIKENINIFEETKISKMFLTSKKITDIIKERNVYFNMLKLLNHIYYISLNNLKTNDKTVEEIIKTIKEKNNDIYRIAKKMRVIEKILSKDTNVNIDLSLNRLLIEMGKINE